MCLLLLAELRLQMHRPESQVLYKLIFVAFDWFQILMHNNIDSYSHYAYITYTIT